MKIYFVSENWPDPYVGAVTPIKAFQDIDRANEMADTRDEWSVSEIELVE